MFLINDGGRMQNIAIA